MSKTRTEWQQRGYDAWLEMWIVEGCTPTVGQCPARYMPEGPNRSEYIHGWVEAKREHESTNY